MTDPDLYTHSPTQFLKPRPQPPFNKGLLFGLPLSATIWIAAIGIIVWVMSSP